MVGEEDTELEAGNYNTTGIKVIIGGRQESTSTEKDVVITKGLPSSNNCSPS